jgi:hypothetical protein
VRPAMNSPLTDRIDPGGVAEWRWASAIASKAASTAAMTTSRPASCHRLARRDDRRRLAWLGPAPGPPGGALSARGSCSAACELSAAGGEGGEGGAGLPAGAFASADAEAGASVSGGLGCSGGEAERFVATGAVASAGGGTEGSATAGALARAGAGATAHADCSLVAESRRFASAFGMTIFGRSRRAAEAASCSGDTVLRAAAAGPPLVVPRLGDGGRWMALVPGTRLGSSGAF